MSYVILGLGNPDEEYENTRHNVGRQSLEIFAKKNDFSEWKNDKKSSSEISKGKVGKSNVTLILPNTYMNRSGETAKYFVKTQKAAEKLIVVHDDLDLPLGKIKLSFNRGSGGHKGVESIARHLKTKAFIRLRVGISAATPSGKIKKVRGEDNVQDFVLGKFKKADEDKVKKVYKQTEKALAEILENGLQSAMGLFNQ